MEILGVDFSGARSDNNTWLAQGSLDDRELVLRCCRALPREELTALLADIRGPVSAALDFPFSVPLPFARYWTPHATSMVDLWTAATETDLDMFIAVRDVFVDGWGEPKRVCDTHFPECFSCLHKANPNMVPMTFHGMRMLARLWGKGWAVPPLEPPEPNRGVLLEAMPGAALRALGLPYKGYKNGTKALVLRAQILDELSTRAGLTMPNLDEFRELCLGNHDALDSVVAAIAACLWARDPSLFRLPPDHQGKGLDPTVRLEGWLYAPVFMGSHPR